MVVGGVVVVLAASVALGAAGGGFGGLQLPVHEGRVSVENAGALLLGFELRILPKEQRQAELMEGGLGPRPLGNGGGSPLSVEETFSVVVSAGS